MRGKYICTELLCRMWFVVARPCLVKAREFWGMYRNGFGFMVLRDEYCVVQPTESSRRGSLHRPFQSCPATITEFNSNFSLSSWISKENDDSAYCIYRSQLEMSLVSCMAGDGVLYGRR